MNIRQLVIVFLMGLCLLGKGGELCATEKGERNYHEFEIWYKLLEYDLSPDGEWGMWRIQYAMGVDSLHICHLQFKVRSINTLRLQWLYLQRIPAG